jgi:acyl carrier protein
MVSLARTTSGKVQRTLCRQQYLDGSLNVVARWTNASGRGALTATDSAHAAPGGGSPKSGSEPSDLSLEFAGRTAASAAAVAGEASRPVKPPPFTQPDRPLTASEIDRLAERIEAFLLEWLIERAGAAAEEADRERPFAEYGLDSLAAVELSAELEQWLHVPLTPIVAWNYPTPAALSRYLAEVAGGAAPPAAASDEAPGQPSDAEFEQLLAEVEGLSESETRAALTRSDPQ